MIAMGNFWAAFFLLLIWIPLIMLWVFTLKDLLQRGLKGWIVALWLAAIIFLPWLGVLVYWIAKPPSKRQLDVDKAYHQSMDRLRNEAPKS